MPYAPAVPPYDPCGSNFTAPDDVNPLAYGPAAVGPAAAAYGLAPNAGFVPPPPPPPAE